MLFAVFFASLVSSFFEKKKLAMLFLLLNLLLMGSFLLQHEMPSL